MENFTQMEFVLYILRHTEHHLGEFSAAARLLHLERPSWIYLKGTPAFIIEKASQTGVAGTEL